MKKLVLLIACTFIFTACEIEDDGPTREVVYSEVTKIEVPEYFEAGKTYDIEVTYLLPDACHEEVGLRVQRGAQYQEEEAFNDVYILGLASHDPTLTTCPKEDEDLTATEDFRIGIHQTSDTLNFFLFTGVDENDKPIYKEVEVPVGAPEGTGDNNGENNGDTAK